MKFLFAIKAVFRLNNNMDSCLTSSPTERALLRKSQHKFSSPPWKDVYKKRCFESLRKSRETFLKRFRSTPSSHPSSQSTIKDVMTEEWNELRKDHTNLPTCTELLFPTDDEEITYLNSIIEEIQAALQTEEQYLLDMYCQDYEANLCASIDQLSTDSVVCPICQKYALLMNKGVIICRCGLRINTEQDALTLDYVRQSIERGIENHNSSCEQTATFSAANTYSIDNLLMTCEQWQNCNPTSQQNVQTGSYSTIF